MKLSSNVSNFGNLFLPKDHITEKRKHRDFEKNLAVFCNHKIHLFISIRLKEDYCKQINTPDSYFHL